MTLGAERRAVQNPFVKYAVEAGWTYLKKDEAIALRNGGVESPILDAVFMDYAQRLNPGIVNSEKAHELAKQLRRVRPTIEGNFEVWKFLKGLRTVFVESEKREKNVQLLYSDHVEKNVFHVTDEFTFSNGTPPNIRADIVFFINGIPILIVETKSARDSDGISNALGDIRYYHEKGPEFVALNQLHAITHLIHFYYGATWNLSTKALFNWRDEAVKAGDFESLCKTFIAPRRVLKVLTEFILFTRKNDRLQKLVLRPHQMRASDRCIARAKDEKKQRGLIWHTQGSGKTFTMITTARRLIEDPSLNNPTVLMIIDRTELEGQVERNLKAAGFRDLRDTSSTEGKPFIMASSKDDLKKTLKDDQRGLIVSMIHKFDNIPDNLSARKNIFVLIDEAHRTTGGDLGNYLMGALPNATYLGFTGTPIDRTAKGKGTFKTFGVDDKDGFLDKYSIKESIQDGTTVPLNYAIAPNELKVDRAVLEAEFLNLAEAEGMTDVEELNSVLDRAVTLKNMLKNRDRIAKVAKFVADHYKSNVEPMGYKAFMVAVDREACCFYKEELDKHLPPEWSRVVISQAGKKDSQFMQKFYLDEAAETKLREEFDNPDTLPKILIVTEKLLTGFDAPVLYSMYLDKPMRDHVLLQAIARVNRPYENEAKHLKKTAGFVLDFVGIFDKLEKALAFDSKDVSGVIEGIDILKKRFADMMKKGREEFIPIPEGKKDDKAVEAVLNHFMEQKVREDFYAFFRELQDVYEILTPDAYLRPFVDDFNRILNMYFIVRANFDRNAPLDRDFLKKTSQLVQDQTKSGKIEDPTRYQQLTAEAIAALGEGDESDTVKVFNLLKALTQMVHERSEGQPYLISIGERVQAIAEAFEARQLSTQQALDRLRGEVQEVQGAEDERAKSGLSPDGFAVFHVLKSNNVKESLSVSQKIEKAFEANPHWQSSEKQETEVRKSIYKALLEGGVEDAMVALAEKLMRVLSRKER